MLEKLIAYMLFSSMHPPVLLKELERLFTNKFVFSKLMFMNEIEIPFEMLIIFLSTLMLLYEFDAKLIDELKFWMMMTESNNFLLLLKIFFIYRLEVSQKCKNLHSKHN